MSLNSLTPGEWLNRHKSLSAQEEYDFLKKTLEQDLTADFARATRLLDIILDLFVLAIGKKEYDKVLEIQDLVHRQDTTVFGWERFYVDSSAVGIHLFKKDTEAVKKSMESFIAEPVESIDSLIPVFDKLKYYGYSEFVQFFSKKVYNKVRDSDRLVGGAEDFAFVILVMEYQDLYQNRNKGPIIKRKEFIKRLKAYDFGDEKELSADYDYILRDDDFTGLRRADLEHNRRESFQKLFQDFGKYVFDHKDMNFPTAYDIWMGAWETFDFDNLETQKNDSLQGFFKLNQNELYKYIDDRFGFLSNRKPVGVVVLWGIQYVYDFLRSKHFVTDDNYFAAVEFIKNTKMELIEGFGDKIWQYSFVHSWGRPDSIGGEEFNREKEYFEKTFREKTDVKEYLPAEYFQKKAAVLNRSRNKTTVRKTGPKIGRNAPCPCGSGKKYKKCCGAFKGN